MSLLASCLWLLVSGPPVAPQGAEAPSWPQWRGPLGTGVAPGADPPLTWSESSNVRWKTPLPGLGHASPVVWKDTVFVTTAIPVGEPGEPRPEDAPGAHHNLRVTQRWRFAALAVDLATGRTLWQRDLHEAFPPEGGHVTGSYASASPVTDGERLFAFFGSNGLYALDASGEVLWQRDLGRMHTKHGHGEGSSPALFGDTLLVNWDHERESFLAAFDARTGEERWRTDRDELTSWTSPIVVEVDGAAQVVVSGTQRIRGYDLDSGRVLWECGGLSHNVVATPVASGGMLFAASSYEKQALVALRLEGAEGDLSDTDHVAWVRRRATPYVPSPLLYDDALYILHHYQGMLARLDPTTGEEAHRPLRIEGVHDVYASPVGAAGRVYLTDRSGVTVVLSHEERPRILARNHLDDRFSASAAVVGRDFVLRGERFLYCLSEE